MRNVLVAIVLGGLVSACGGRRVMLEDQVVVTHPDVFEVTAEWVKDKRTKFDLRFTIINLSDDAIVVRRRDLSCSRGDTRGELRMRNDSAFDIGAGNAQTFTGICETGDVGGPFILAIAKVYDADGRDPLVEGFVWAADEFGGLAEEANEGRREGLVQEKTKPMPVVARKSTPRPAPKPAVEPPPPVKPMPLPAPVDAHSLEAGASQMAVKRYLIGRELYLQGNLEGAAAEFQSAFDIFPQSAKLAFNLARCHERMGNNAKAIGFYEKYLELAPAGAPDRGDIEKLLAAMKKRGA